MKTTNYLTQTIAAVACISRIANAHEETAQDLTIMDSTTRSSTAPQHLLSSPKPDGMLINLDEAEDYYYGNDADEEHMNIVSIGENVHEDDYYYYYYVYYTDDDNNDDGTPGRSEGETHDQGPPSDLATIDIATDGHKQAISPSQFTNEKTVQELPLKDESRGSTKDDADDDDYNYEFLSYPGVDKETAMRLYYVRGAQFMNCSTATVIEQINATESKGSESTRMMLSI